MKRTQIERLLPEVFRRTAARSNPLPALLDTMEALHAPAEARLDRLDEVFDPHRTDERFLPLLAAWTDLDRLFTRSSRRATTTRSQAGLSTGNGRLRELIAGAAQLSQWRGTRRGLVAFLETATGAKGFAVDEQVDGPDGLPLAFHIRVRAPQALLPHRPLIERIVESEKPAHLTYDIEFTAQEG
jgi:phage tail-like protein